MSEETVTPRCPVGVLSFEGQTYVYEPFNHGYSVRVFGSGIPVGVSPAMREAIEVDIEKKKAKEARGA